MIKMIKVIIVYIYIISYIDIIHIKYHLQVDINMGATLNILNMMLLMIMVG